MITRLGWGFAVLGMFSLAFYLGCDRQPTRVPQPPYSPSGEASKAIELFDANKDGKIAGLELDKSPGLKASLTILGTDKDKGVTYDHIVARVKSWKESLLGRTTVSCQVFRNGQPLEGATVKFVPEPFLNDALEDTATGETKQGGMAMLSMPTEPGPDAPPPGVPPGIYRVEITKAGDNIPAKYNTATELGQEISVGNIEIQKGIKFYLKY